MSESSERVDQDVPHGTAHTSAIRIITTLVTTEPILLRVVKFMRFGAAVTEKLVAIYSNLLEIRRKCPSEGTPRRRGDEEQDRQRGTDAVLRRRCPAG
ncbi:MAG: hypothetical protein ACLS6O_02035 [Bifidobacterium sp.]